MTMDDVIGNKRHVRLIAREFRVYRYVAININENVDGIFPCGWLTDGIYVKKRETDDVNHDVIANVKSALIFLFSLWQRAEKNLRGKCEILRMRYYEILRMRIRIQWTLVFHGLALPINAND